MKSLNDTTSLPQTISNADVASGGDCVITVNAVAGERHTIDWITFGYYDTPAANTAMVITDVTANTVKLQAPMTTKGPGQFTFGVRGFQLPLSAGLEVKLEDGGQIKDLTIQYR